MKKSKILIALLTVLAMLFAVCLTACSPSAGQTGEPHDSTADTTATEQHTTEEITTEDNTEADTTEEETTEEETTEAEEPVDASGSFVCGTGDKYFDLLVKWTATTATDGVRLHVSVYLTSWSVYCNVRGDNYISINGEKTIFRSEIIDVGNVFTETLLGESETVLPAGTMSADIEAAFHYNGSYSDIQYDWLTASETVSFN